MDQWFDQLVQQVPPGARLPLLACLAAFAAWFVLHTLVMIAIRPLPVRPGPATQDLPGEEPPAVVSVLANGWSVTEDAAESTLLDLAARGYFELRQPDNDPRHTTIHVTAEDPKAAAAAAARQARVLRAAGGAQAPLTAYETQLLKHVKGIAVGGVVPLTALTFRDEGHAAGWSSTFTASVIKDAKRRGLIARRVPPWVVSLLSVAAAVPSVAFSWFFWTADHGQDGRALFTGVIPWALLSSYAGRQQGFRGTATGRAVAARWLGVREYLEVDQSFAALPPSAVAVWDRYLAYGDALGVTHVCSTVIDLGMGNRDRVWSSFGGHWHQVRVRYPSRVVARYGISTPRLVLGASGQLVIGYLLVRMAGLDALSGDGGSPVETGILVVAFACIGRGIYRLARAVTDTLGVRTLTGEVLWIAPWKTRTKDDEAITYLYYLAVDDGTSDRTTAWALPQDLRSKHPYQVGRSVELTVRPWSRRVTAARAVPGSGSGPAAAPAAVPAPVPAPAPAPVPAPMPQQVPVAPQVSGSQAASAGFPFQALPVEVLPVEALSVPALPVPAIPVDPVVASVPVAAAVPAVPVTAAVPAAAVAAVATAATVPELLTADELSAWFGVPVQPGQSLPVGPSTSAWSFRCEPPGSAGPGSPGPGSPGAPADVVLVSAGRGTADTMALDRARHGTPVPGVGEEAYLVEQGAVARWGSVVVQVRTPPHLGVGPDALVSALQAAVVRVAKQRVG